MKIKPIRTRTDYRQALKEIETLMNAQAGTPEGERLDVLATLVEAYERKHFPMDLPDGWRPSSSVWSSPALRRGISCR
jgi:HTH-type transcriptional regulator / antitoxin HigA